MLELQYVSNQMSYSILVLVEPLVIWNSVQSVADFEKKKYIQHGNTNPFIATAQNCTWVGGIMGALNLYSGTIMLLYQQEQDEFMAADVIYSKKWWDIVARK